MWRSRLFRVFMALVIILALLVIAAAGLWQLARARDYQLFGDLVSRVETERMQVALTFDDGPSARYTREVIDLLARYEVSATFFVTGREVEENMAEARALVAAGHELGNHSWSHPRMSLSGYGEVVSEVERTDAVIRAAGHEGEILFRPPYGHKLVTLPYYLWQNGRTTIMWDVEPESYPEIADDPRSIAAHVLDTVRPGSIVILHVMYESGEPSREALPAIIEGLREQGYELVTVSELLAQR